MSQQRGEDEALIARIARGDREALERLYFRHAPWVTERLEARCPEAELVDTAVQDTFLAVWKNAKKYRGEGAVGAWIWGIAIRRLIDQIRKRRPEPVAPDVLVAAAGITSSSLEDDVLASGAFGAVGPALGTLTPDLQAVIIATAIDGLTTKEASRLLGIPHGTVKTRLMRARKHLQETLR